MAAVKPLPQMRAPAKARGFTLIELLTVVAVIAILGAIALPSYNESVRKGRRGQAKSDLVELAQRAERYRTINNTFAGFTVTGADAQSPHTGTAHYNLAIANVTATGFDLTATPTGGQTADRCGTLSVNAAGVKAATGGSAQDCF